MMSSFRSRWLDHTPTASKSSEPRQEPTDKTCKGPTPDTAELKATKPKPTQGAAPSGVALAAKPDTLPRLPWQLERLLSAASSGVLAADLPGVPDVPHYTLSWGCSYLVGDRAEALRRLWRVHAAWQERLN